MREKNTKISKFISALLSIVMLLSLMSFPSMSAEIAEFSQVFSENFEKYPDETEAFSLPEDSNYAMCGEGCIAGIAGSTDSINGDRSLRLIKDEFSFEGVEYQSDVVSISMNIKVERDYDGTFVIGIITQDNTSEIQLVNSDIYDLKRDTVYALSVTLTRGSAVASVEINGTKAESINLKEKYYMFCGLDFVSQRAEYIDEPVTETEESAEEIITPEERVYTTEDSAIVIDDITFSTKGKEYVQKYSSQETGTVSEPELETKHSKKSVDVYINSTKIEMSKTYVTDSTVYISAEQFFKSIDVPYTYDKDSKMLVVKNDKVQASVQIPDNTVTVNGEQVELLYPVRMIDSVIMISPGFINEVFNAIVWWDKDGGILVITTGSYKNDNKLRTLGGRLFMNGSPFYAIGAETTELFERVMATIVSDEKYPDGDSQISIVSGKLRAISEAGYKYIRVKLSCSTLSNIMYDDVSLGKYLEATDKLFELCDSYGLRVCVCLDLISDSFVTKVQTQKYGWINGTENIVDLVSDRDSESRVIVQRYIEKIVSRYKDRETVLMYEIADSANEMADNGAEDNQVAYSIGQLGLFYADCMAFINEIDSDIVVAGGDSCIRSNQWNLYKNVLNGLTEAAYTDTDEESLYALYTINEGLDIIESDASNFSVDVSANPVDGRTVNDFSALAEQALSLRKALYLKNVSTDSGKEISYLTSLIEAGVQLSFWKFSEFTGEDSSSSGDLINEVAAGSDVLNSTYAVNPVEEENTDAIWGNSEINIFDPASVITGAAAAKEESFKEALIRFSILSAILIICSGAILFYFRNKKVR